MTIQIHFTKSITLATILFVLAALTFSCQQSRMESSYGFRIELSETDKGESAAEADRLGDILDRLTTKYGMKSISGAAQRVIRTYQADPQLLVYLYASIKDDDHIEVSFGPMLPNLELTAERRRFINDLISILRSEYGDRLQKLE